MTAIALPSGAQDDITAFRIAQQGMMRTGWIVIAAGVVVFLIAVNQRNGSVGFIGVLAAILAIIIGWSMFKHARKRIADLDASLAAWTYACQRSDPNATLTAPVALRPTETLVYVEGSYRFEERKTATVGTSTPRGSIGRAVVGGLLFGPAGAIVGSQSARSTTSHTDLYNVVPIDGGDLVITTERMLFLGEKHTTEVPLANVMRWTLVPGSDRVAAEYAGRVPGESYSVHPLLFNMAMARRGRDCRFTLPSPPDPLPSSMALDA